ncbi:MAG: FHA domain-containing protein [Deltaproteobacteria bacterium]|nr:MAG: FHA domain-containing protein [Deltaproteobacteria bacterium]
MTDRIRLDVDQLVIGRRDPDAGHFPDIDLTHHHPDDPHLSRRHARVLRRAGGWIVEDLSGNAATWLNDRAHLLDREVATLSHGDRILVSDSVVLRFDAGTLPP